ncbi:DNA primase large subunit Spp2 [Marasmius sp. AFHP31]|nr:DNA primase large subunit Spp2 [Marasmius sp. AFHP31]
MEVEEEVKAEETEDQRALRAILSGVNGEEEASDLTIPTISTPMSEGDAYKQDVDELPDSATLDDYGRVPVAQFGAALLRGMGWKEGTAASRKGKGIVEPYIPESRPALLGIGAKEMETFDDGGKKGSSRPERRYVPVVKKDRDGNIIDDSNGKKRDRDRGDRRRERSTSPRRDSRASSRRGSPDRRDYDDRRRDTKSRYDDYDDRRRDRDRDYRRRDERDRERDRDRDRDRRRDRSRDRRRDHSR